MPAKTTKEKTARGRAHHGVSSTPGKNGNTIIVSRPRPVAPAARNAAQRTRGLMPPNSPAAWSDSLASGGLTSPTGVEESVKGAHGSPQRGQARALPAFSSDTLSDLPHCEQRK